MATQPTDKSKEFIRSGMTLITQRESDKYLARYSKQNNNKQLK